jgi:hypothetical protein
MDAPSVGTETQAVAAESQAACKGSHGQAAGGRGARMSLWIGLIVFVLGVVGRVLIYVIPSEEWVSASSYANYQLLSSLQVVAESVLYLGVVWVGVYLARWGVCKKKD